MKNALRVPLLALLAPAAAGLQGPFVFEDPVRSGWPEGAASERIVAGDTTGNGYVDAVVLPAEGSPAVTLKSVDVWNEQFEFGGQNVRDLAVFANANADHSAAPVTAGPTGVRLWRWNAQEGSYDVQTLAGPWTAPEAVVAYSHPLSDWTFLVVLDAGGARIYSQMFIESPAQFFFSIATVQFKGNPADAMTLFDRNGDGQPEIAVQRATGLTVYDLYGAPLLTIDQQVSKGLTTVLDNPSGDELVWIVKNGLGLQDLYVVGAGGYEPPVALAPRTAVAIDSDDFDGDGLEDVALLTEGADELVILRNQAGGSPGSPTFSTDSAGLYVLDPYDEASPYPAAELVLAADLDHDGDGDILANGNLYRNRYVNQADHVPYTMAIGHQTDGNIRLTLHVRPPEEIPDDANVVAITAFGWQQLGVGFPLLPGVAGYQEHPVPDPWPILGPPILTVELSQVSPFDTTEVYFLFTSLVADDPGGPRKAYRPEAIAFTRTDLLLDELKVIFGPEEVPHSHDSEEGGGVRIDPPPDIPPFPIGGQG